MLIVYIHTLGTTESISDSSATPTHLYFDTIVLDHTVKINIQATLQIQVCAGQHTTHLHSKIDTGAEGNFIPVDIHKKSPCDSNGVPLNLTPSAMTITAFGGYTVQHYGICTLTLSHNDHSKPYEFHVVNIKGPTILGLPTCTDMKLITLNYSIATHQKYSLEATVTQKAVGNPIAKEELLQQSKDRFKGVGCFQGEFHIVLDPTVPPEIYPP